MKIETFTIPPQQPKNLEYVSMTQKEWHMLINLPVPERKSLHNIQFLDESYIYIGGREYPLNVEGDDPENWLQRVKAKQDKVEAWFNSH